MCYVVIIVSWELLFGLPVGVRCDGGDMTILGSVPSWLEEQTSVLELEPLQY
jgi:hypothetical protein